MDRKIENRLFFIFQQLPIFHKKMFIKALTCVKSRSILVGMNKIFEQNIIAAAIAAGAAEARACVKSWAAVQEL